MPFDPTKPQENTPLDAAEMRSQLNGLADQIAERLTEPQVEQLIASEAAGPMPNLALLDMMVSNPPTQAEMQTVVNKIDEMIVLLRRL